MITLVMKLKKSYKFKVKIVKNNDSYLYKFNDALLLPYALKMEIALVLDKYLKSDSNGKS